MYTNELILTSSYKEEEEEEERYTKKTRGRGITDTLHRRDSI